MGSGAGALTRSPASQLASCMLRHWTFKTMTKLRQQLLLLRATQTPRYTQPLGRPKATEVLRAQQSSLHKSFTPSTCEKLPAHRLAPSPTLPPTSASSKFHTHAARKMSDADYAAFLDKANQDTSGGEATTQSKKVGTKSVNTQVPSALQSVEEYYTSDADEPFEPVALSYSGDGISARKFVPLFVGSWAGWRKGVEGFTRGRPMGIS